MGFIEDMAAMAAALAGLTANAASPDAATQPGGPAANTPPAPVQASLVSSHLFSDPARHEIRKYSQNPNNGTISADIYHTEKGHISGKPVATHTISFDMPMGPPVPSIHYENIPAGQKEPKESFTAFLTNKGVSPVLDAKLHSHSTDRDVSYKYIPPDYEAKTGSGATMEFSTPGKNEKYTATFVDTGIAPSMLASIQKHTVGADGKEHTTDISPKDDPKLYQEAEHLRKETLARAIDTTEQEFLKASKALGYMKTQEKSGKNEKSGEKVTMNDTPHPLETPSGRQSGQPQARTVT